MEMLGASEGCSGEGGMRCLAARAHGVTCFRQGHSNQSLGRILSNFRIWWGRRHQKTPASAGH